MSTFDLDAFRLLFPAYSDELLYPDELILAQSEIALCYASSQSCKCSEYMWQLMTAHLLYMNDQATSGGGGAVGTVQSATIDKVSVTLATSPDTNWFSSFLSGSPYGIQFLALLKKCSAGGAYFGGLPERSAFRSVYGIFPGRRRP